MRRSGWGGWLALAWLGVAGIGPAGAATLHRSDLAIEVHATGLSLPTGMAFVGPDDILVTQKNDGRVRRVLGGVVQAGEALDVGVCFNHERGLLGIAANGESPPRVFVYYSVSSGGDHANCASEGPPDPVEHRIERYTWNAGTGALGSPVSVLTLPITPGPNHNGGVLLLGPPGEGAVADGRLLYAVIGDLNRNGQLQNNAAGAPPDDTSVILRIEQDGTPAAGNPFAGSPQDRYYAYGVRNGFGLALDPVTGDLWDTENGPGSFDEVNRVEPGFNSGWTDLMGPDAEDPQGVGDLFDLGASSTYSDPEFSWRDTAAPTAIVFPHGSALLHPYDDVALVGDTNTGQLYALPLHGTRTRFTFPGHPELADAIADDQAEADLLRIASGLGIVTDLEIGPDGALYVLSFTQGTIFRITGIAAVPTATAPGLALLALALAAGVALRARSHRPWPG